MAGTFAIHAAAPGWDADAVSFMVLYFLALYSLGAWSRGVEVPISAGIVVVCIVLFTLSDGDAFHPADIIFATGFVGGPWAAGLAIRLRRDHAQRLAADNEILQADQEERARRAVVEERARIARELHDVVSHAISVTVLQARGARRTLGHDEDEVRRALNAIEQTNTAALSDMRRLLAVLRDTEDAESGGGDRTPRSRLSTSLNRSLPRCALPACRLRLSSWGTALRAAGRRPVGLPDRAGGAHQRDQARGSGHGRGRPHLRRQTRSA